MKRSLVPLVLLALAACSQAPDPGDVGNIPLTTTSLKTYTASSATIANPERGFYRHTGDCDKSNFVASTLASYRTTNKINLVMCIFYLEQFKTSPISQAQLDRFHRQAATVRAAGLKMVVRFAYTQNGFQGSVPPPGDDAPLSRVLAHLNQLAPYLRSNSDVIAVVQSGFVGTWGEGYYTQNFGNKGVISSTDWANRKAVVDKLLSTLPSSRMVQVRTPKMKRTMYGTTPVAAAAAYRGTPVARVGHHNDCFLASSSDFGTYENTSVEYPYLAADTKYVAMGGETCAVNSPRSDGPTALKELAMFHYSYLNWDYNRAVLDRWSASDLTQVKQRLGYRFSLTSSDFPTSVTRGSTFLAQVSIRNTGWAAPYNPRSVYLVLRNTVTKAVFKISFRTDARRWQPGTSVRLAKNLVIPSTMPVGNYELLLHLPDSALSLKNRPEYAIQMANLGVWEPSKGFNNLGQTIKVN